MGNESGWGQYFYRPVKTNSHCHFETVAFKKKRILTLTVNGGWDSLKNNCHKLIMANIFHNDLGEGP